MNNILLNILGILISFVYFSMLMTLSQRIHFKAHESQRKFVHILTGNWWILALIFFNDVFAASIFPICFALYNYYSLRWGVGAMASLERDSSSGKSYGIILYPVAMIILVFISFVFCSDIRIGGLGLIALAYGDGIAALAGKKFNFLPIYIRGNKKTLSGSIAMFLVVMIMSSAYMFIVGLSDTLSLNLLTSCAIASTATLTELFTPSGADNLTIPLVSVCTYLII